MNCSSIRPLISDYYDGDVTPEERKLVEAHLAGCEDCSRALAEYRVIGGDLRSLSMPMPPSGLRRDVWRAIDASERRAGVFGGAPLRPRSVASGLPHSQPDERRGKGIIAVLTGGGGAWAKAMPAAILLGGLLLVLMYLFAQQNSRPVAAAMLEETSELSDYNKPVHVIFSKRGVIGADAIAHTSVRRLDAGSVYTLTNTVEVRMEFLPAGNGKLAIWPLPAWTPGKRYEVVVDAPNIGLGVADARLDTVVHTLSFGAAAHTPTPTNTPTETPVPTKTPVPPTDTPGPTAVAQDTPQVKTPGPVVEPTRTAQKPTATPAGRATNTPNTPNTPVPPSVTPYLIPSSTNTPLPVTPTVTPVPPTNTPEVVPTRTPPLVTATPRGTQTPVSSLTPRATQTAIGSGTPVATGTPGTPRVPTRTATRAATSTPAPSHGCDFAPVRGFGIVWQSNPDVRQRVGCPEAQEIGITEMVVQRFEGGLMVWRGDTRTIYVFKGGVNDTFGTWQQFRDTWSETEPTPRPSATPPPGLFEPLRGFGKVWRENAEIRNSLGWAIEQERPAGGAWQEFERGYALWTTDRDIYFMSTNSLWQRFEDIFGE